MNGRESIAFSAGSGDLRIWEYVSLYLVSQSDSNTETGSGMGLSKRCRVLGSAGHEIDIGMMIDRQ